MPTRRIRWVRDVGTTQAACRQCDFRSQGLYVARAVRTHLKAFPDHIPYATQVTVTNFWTE